MKNKYWIVVGLLSVALGSPNSTVIKGAYSEMDTVAFVSLKFFIIALFFAPVLAKFIIRNHGLWFKNRKYLLISAAATAVSSVTYYKAIELSNASYTSIVSLLAPIFLIVISNRLIKEKTSKRAVLGITLAAVGGLFVVAIPAFAQGSISAEFSPIATFVALASCISYPVAMIYQRKANEGGVSFAAQAGFSSILISIGVVIVSSLSGNIGNLSE